MEKRETQDQSGCIKGDEMEGRWYPGTVLRAEGGVAGQYRVCSAPLSSGTLRDQTPSWIRSF